MEFEKELENLKEQQKELNQAATRLDNTLFVLDYQSPRSSPNKWACAVEAMNKVGNAISDLDKILD